MPDMLWCALAGLVAGTLVSLPVWVWVARIEHQRDLEYQRLAREAWQRMQDDA